MFYLACTRFNDITYEENIAYRNKTKETVIYGSTLKIRDSYPVGSLIFIAEMNNDKNRIEGIGLIRNLLVHDKRHKIYDNTEYNRYIYRGKYWLSREQIKEFDNEILEIFDTVLFKGKSHLKCRIGISVISKTLFIHWDYEYDILKHKVRDLFIHYFKDKLNNDLDEEKQTEDEPIYFEIIPKKRKREEIKNTNTDINIEI